jgi:hypothetical protein
MILVAIDGRLRDRALQRAGEASPVSWVPYDFIRQRVLASGVLLKGESAGGIKYR